MELCTENNPNHACIVFSNFQAHGNSVILAEQIVGCGVSLSDSICHEQTKSVSLFEGLVTLTDGHLTIKVVLDTLLTKTPTGDIQIKLGCGVIYRIECQDCDSSYIGQSGRALHYHVRQHQSDPPPAHHTAFNDHIIDWDRKVLLAYGNVFIIFNIVYFFICCLM